jgi:virulence factor
MQRERLRVALIGLGDIATKAYLPVLAADPAVEPVLITRDPDRLARLQAAWRVPSGFPTIADALALGPPLDAAFVHAATTSHPPMAHELIAAGVPTFVDKPLALDLASAREMVESARAQRVSFAVCFNRRFAPGYADLADWDAVHTIVLTKNRHHQPDDPRVVVFDDFVHVVDTLRFLVTPDPERLDVVALSAQDRGLARVAITLRQGQRVGIGIMDRDSGQTVEILEAMAPGRTRTVVDLVDVSERHSGQIHRRQPDNWASVSAQRGFVAMVDALLGSVRRGVVLDAGDALATHELCDRILTEVLAQLPD